MNNNLEKVFDYLGTLEETLFTIQDLVKSNAIRIDAVTALLIEKGVFTKEEFLMAHKQLEVALEK
jgi:hypothetical protein